MENFYFQIEKKRFQILSHLNKPLMLHKDVLTNQINYFWNISFIKKRISFTHNVVIPNKTIHALPQIQKWFLWNSSSPKVKYETICKDFQYGRLKNDEKSKTISWQCSQIKKLHDESFHEWKTFRIFFFHSNLDFNISYNSVPEFFINIFHLLKEHFFLSLTYSKLS